MRAVKVWGIADHDHDGDFTLNLIGSITLPPKFGIHTSKRNFLRIRVFKRVSQEPHFLFRHLNPVLGLERLMQPHFCNSVRGDLPLKSDEPTPEQFTQTLSTRSIALVDRYRFSHKIDDLDQEGPRSHCWVHDDDIIVRNPQGRFSFTRKISVNRTIDRASRSGV